MTIEEVRNEWEMSGGRRSNRFSWISAPVTLLTLPLVNLMSLGNSEMNAMWRSSRGVYFELNDKSVYIRGLWTVGIMNVWPPRKCRKCFTARYSARSSLPKIQYRHSVGVSWFDKTDIYCHAPSMICWKTTPTAVSDASTVTDEGALNLRWASIASLARTFLTFAKAWATS